MEPRPATSNSARGDVDPAEIVATAPGTPAWVKAFALIILIAVVVLVVLLITGGPGGHGPSRH